MSLLFGVAAVFGRAQTYTGYQDVHDFGGTVSYLGGSTGKDASVASQLVFDSAGDMYFITQNDTALSELSAKGTYTVLHLFTGSPDGQFPTDSFVHTVFPPAGDEGALGACVVLDGLGNLFGICSGGGAYGSASYTGGTVWEFTKAGDYKIIHDFGGTVTNAGGTSGPDGYVPYPFITFDANGNMYGTTQAGGAYGQANVNISTSSDPQGGIVWEITKSGTYIDLHDFTGTIINSGCVSGPDGSVPNVFPVLIGGSGNVYGTTGWGGPYDTAQGGYGNLWEVTNKGAYKDLHDFGGSVTLTNGSNGTETSASSYIELNAEGDIFGCSEELDASDSLLASLWEFSGAGTYKDVHDFGGTVTNANGTSGPDGTSPNFPLKIDNSGNLYGICLTGGPYGTAYLGGNVWTFTAKGVYKDLHDFGGTITYLDGTSGMDGDATSFGVTLDPAGNLFGSCFGGGEFYNPYYSPGDGLIWEIEKSGAYKDLHDFGGSTITYTTGATGPDGFYPYSLPVTFDPNGNLFGEINGGGYFMPSGEQAANFMIWKLKPSAESVSSLTLKPSTVLGGSPSTGTVTLSQPAFSAWTVNLNSEFRV